MFLSQLSGLIFYAVAVLAAVSTIAGIMALVAGAGAGAAVVLAKNAQYIQGGRSSRRAYIRRQNNPYGRRQHYE